MDVLQPAENMIAMVDPKYRIKLNSLLQSKVISESDFVCFILMFVEVTKRLTHHENGVHAYADVIKDWIGGFETIIDGIKANEKAQTFCRSYMSKFCSPITKAYFDLLGYFRKYDPRYLHEFYTNWKLIATRMDPVKRADSFIHNIEQFKMLIQDLRTADNRMEQFAIMSVLIVYIEQVPVEEFDKIKENDNEKIVDGIVLLKDNASILNRHAFLHDINTSGRCIDSLSPKKIVCEKFGINNYSCDFGMWLDFNKNDQSVAFFAISLKNCKNQLFGIGTRIRMKESRYDEHLLEINGNWVVYPHKEELRKGVATVQVYLSDPIQNSISKSVESLYRFRCSDSSVSRVFSTDQNHRVSILNGRPSIYNEKSFGNSLRFPETELSKSLNVTSENEKLSATFTVKKRPATKSNQNPVNIARESLSVEKSVGSNSVSNHLNASSLPIATTNENRKLNKTFTVKKRKGNHIVSDDASQPLSVNSSVDLNRTSRLATNENRMLNETFIVEQQPSNVASQLISTDKSVEESAFDSNLTYDIQPKVNRVTHKQSEHDYCAPPPHIDTYHCEHIELPPINSASSIVNGIQRTADISKGTKQLSEYDTRGDYDENYCDWEDQMELDESDFFVQQSNKWPEAKRITVLQNITLVTPTTQSESQHSVEYLPREHTTVRYLHFSQVDEETTVECPYMLNLSRNSCGTEEIRSGNPNADESVESAQATRKRATNFLYSSWMDEKVSAKQKVTIKSSSQPVLRQPRNHKSVESAKIHSENRNVNESSKQKFQLLNSTMDLATVDLEQTPYQYQTPDSCPSPNQYDSFDPALTSTQKFEEARTVEMSSQRGKSPTVQPSSGHVAVLPTTPTPRFQPQENSIAEKTSSQRFVQRTSGSLSQTASKSPDRSELLPSSKKASSQQLVHSASASVKESKAIPKCRSGRTASQQIDQSKSSSEEVSKTTQKTHTETVNTSLQSHGPSLLKPKTASQGMPKIFGAQSRTSIPSEAKKKPTLRQSGTLFQQTATSQGMAKAIPELQHQSEVISAAEKTSSQLVGKSPELSKITPKNQDRSQGFTQSNNSPAKTESYTEEVILPATEMEIFTVDDLPADSESFVEVPNPLEMQTEISPEGNNSCDRTSELTSSAAPAVQETEPVHEQPLQDQKSQTPGQLIAQIGPDEMISTTLLENPPAKIVQQRVTQQKVTTISKITKKRAAAQPSTMDSISSNRFQSFKRSKTSQGTKSIKALAFNETSSQGQATMDENCDDIHVNESGAVFDSKGCVFNSNAELQRAVLFYIKNDGLRYMKTETFEIIDPVKQEKFERKLRTVHKMMNSGLENLHRNDNKASDHLIDEFQPTLLEKTVEGITRKRVSKTVRTVIKSKRTTTVDGIQQSEKKVTFASSISKFSYVVDDDEQNSIQSPMKKRKLISTKINVRSQKVPSVSSEKLTKTTQTNDDIESATNVDLSMVECGLTALESDISEQQIDVSQHNDESTSIGIVPQQTKAPIHVSSETSATKGKPNVLPVAKTQYIAPASDNFSDNRNDEMEGAPCMSMICNETLNNLIARLNEIGNVSIHTCDSCRLLKEILRKGVDRSQFDGLQTHTLIDECSKLFNDVLTALRSGSNEFIERLVQSVQEVSGVDVK